MGRTAGFNAHILPRCRQLVKATGQRMAYEAAQASKDVPSEMLAVFEANCIAADFSWYCEHEGSNRMTLFTQHVKAYEAVLPQLPQLLESCQAAVWATSPLLKEKDWEYFVNTLPVFRGKEIESKSRL
jgi:acyl-CoA oxidase